MDNCLASVATEVASPTRKRPRSDADHQEDGTANPDEGQVHTGEVGRGGDGGGGPDATAFDTGRIETNTHRPSSTSPTETNKPLPAYGSQQYWEERYENLAKKYATTESTSKQNEEGGEAPDAFHAWYFNFEELAPLIMPLILGGPTNDDEDDDDEDKGDVGNDSVNDDQDDDLAIDTATHSKNNYKEGKDVETDSKYKQSTNADSDEEISDDDEEDDDEEGGEAPGECIGLAKDGPISVVEVGCGDVPMGRDLARSIQDLEGSTGVGAADILKKVVCLDYSQNVVDAMREEQKLHDRSYAAKHSKGSTIPVTYEVADARKLPYADESFHLLLEKGTLDAMLSDNDGKGSNNCRLIVAECARVVSRRGCIVIVSHLNAHVQAGLEWLNDVIVPGLRKGAGQFEWQVEVHGSEATTPTENEEDTGDDEPESPGPAVYIIRKGPLIDDAGGMEHKNEQPPIPLRFFTY